MAETHAAGITDADLAEAAANPASFQVDGLSQSNRSLSELIAADKYLRKRSLLARGRHPLAGICTRVVAPGPMG